MTYWPEDWRGTLAEAFDSATRPVIPEVRVIVVGNDGRYTGEVWCIRPGEPQCVEYDPALAGKVARR